MVPPSVGVITVRAWEGPVKLMTVEVDEVDRDEDEDDEDKKVDDVLVEVIVDDELELVVVAAPGVTTIADGLAMSKET